VKIEIGTLPRSDGIPVEAVAGSYDAVDPRRVFRGECNVVLRHLAPLFDLSEEFGVTECTATVRFWLRKRRRTNFIRYVQQRNSRRPIEKLILAWDVNEHSIDSSRGPHSEKKIEKKILHFFDAKSLLSHYIVMVYPRRIQRPCGPYCRSAPIAGG